ncbi:MAG TPA: sigma-70 family RNA polymerase sigma factor [Abditibacterium sp.]|jgi:RNA polymerase sigma-70 factor (ECF subfamily)
MSDAQLIKRLQDGERIGFETLLDRFGPLVQNLARRYASSSADAEDLTQEIFVDLFKSASSFRGEAQLSTWIYRVALNHCLRWKEKQSRENERRENVSSDEIEVPSHDVWGDPQKRAARGELGEKVQCALGELSEMHREIVILHEMHGLTYAQCAQILEIPVGTVKSRLSNAFSQLRRVLKPYVLGSGGEL